MRVWEVFPWEFAFGTLTEFATGVVDELLASRAHAANSSPQQTIVTIANFLISRLYTAGAARDPRAMSETKTFVRTN